MLPLCIPHNPNPQAGKQAWIRAVQAGMQLSVWFIRHNGRRDMFETHKPEIEESRNIVLASIIPKFQIKSVHLQKCHAFYYD